MLPISWHYPLTALTVLGGAIGFMKVFDFLAAQSAKRLLEMAEACRTDPPCS